MVVRSKEPSQRQQLTSAGKRGEFVRFLGGGGQEGAGTCEPSPCAGLCEAEGEGAYSPEGRGIAGVFAQGPQLWLITA